MCGRYVSPDEASIEREFDLPAAGWRFPASFNVAPSQAVPAIRWIGGAARADLLRFGLVPFFAKGKPGKYSTINARIETVESSASYRGPWRHAQRCLVPARGFYEWHVNADGSKQPFYIHPTDQGICAFAGLWDRSVGDDGTAIESFTIITMPANDLMAEIHNAKARMPAILPRAQRNAWLCGSQDAARAALIAYPSQHLAAYPVGTRVNSPRNNDERLIEPVPAAHWQARVP
ncbi:MAG TPA: SOS response-associated peptidase [Steroidobacteraceae bacterium]|nr:SOS response-associated peptidase [Steroidobacteraceae bacterium]